MTWTRRRRQGCAERGLVSCRFMKHNPTVEIRDLLVRAFTEEIKQSVRLSHRDCVELRQNLISLRDEDVKRLLPYVLIDLLETHSDDYRNIEDGDAVIRLLTPIAQDQYPDVPGLTRAEEDYMARAQGKLYSLFTSDQVAAIAKWLEAAKSWEDLCFCREQVEIAHRYWSEKAA